MTDQVERSRYTCSACNVKSELCSGHRLQAISDQQTRHLKTGLFECQKSGHSNGANRVFKELLVDVPQGLAFDDYHAVMVCYERFGYLIIFARLN